MTEKKTNSSEIFRHLRPHWFDYKSHRLIPHSQGGVSFLLRPQSPGTYDFWIYICPENATFSSRQAVKTLRDSADRGIVPFGTIQISDEPITDTLTRFVINEQMALPSEASHQLLKITIINSYANKKLQEAEEKAKGAISAYEDSK